MLAQATKIIWYKYHYPIIDSHSDVIFIVKFIGNIDVYKIQSSCGNLEGNKFLDLFAKGFAIINI